MLPQIGVGVAAVRTFGATEVIRRVARLLVSLQLPLASERLAANSARCWLGLREVIRLALHHCERDGICAIWLGAFVDHGCFFLSDRPNLVRISEAQHDLSFVNKFRVERPFLWKQ